MADLHPNILQACREEGVSPQLVAFLATALQQTETVQKQGLRHVTPRALCESVRDLALDEFGGMALYVLEAWGVKQTRDIGEVIARLQKHEVFRFAEGESADDFDHLLDLPEALSVEQALRRDPAE